MWGMLARMSSRRNSANPAGPRRSRDRARVAAAATLVLLALLLSASLAGQRSASAEVITGGNFRIRFTGSMTPPRLPRTGSLPISVSVQGAVQELPGPPPSPLREFVVAVNRHVHISVRGLPTCSRRRIAGDSTRQALARCRGALVGGGHFSAHIDIPEQAPFPASGHLLVFNSRYRGHRALLGHVYGINPTPTALDMYFRLRRESHGPFGLALAAAMPDVGQEWGYVTGFQVNLGRHYLYRGRQRSLLAAGCPAPAGLTSAPFKLSRGVFYLADGSTRSRVLSSVCHVAGS